MYFGVMTVRHTKKEAAANPLLPFYHT